MIALQVHSYLERRGWLGYIREWRRELENIIANLFIAIVVGLIFLRLGNSIGESSAKLSMIFFLVLKAAFSAIAGIAQMFVDRPVFYRYAKSLRSPVSCHLPILVVNEPGITMPSCRG